MLLKGYLKTFLIIFLLTKIFFNFYTAIIQPSFEVVSEESTYMATTKNELEITLSSLQ